MTSAGSFRTSKSTSLSSLSSMMITEVLQSFAVCPRRGLVGSGVKASSSEATIPAGGGIHTDEGRRRWKKNFRRRASLIGREAFRCGTDSMGSATGAAIIVSSTDDWVAKRRVKFRDFWKIKNHYLFDSYGLKKLYQCSAFFPSRNRLTQTLHRLTFQSKVWCFVECHKLADHMQ